MAEHLPYYGHEQGCYNSKIPWGPEPCSGCVSLRRAFSQGQRDEHAKWSALIKDRIRDLQSCTKHDDCMSQADILLVTLDDYDYANGVTDE